MSISTLSAKTWISRIWNHTNQNSRHQSVHYNPIKILQRFLCIWSWGQIFRFVAIGWLIWTDKLSEMRLFCESLTLCIQGDALLDFMFLKAFSFTLPHFENPITDVLTLELTHSPVWTTVAQWFYIKNCLQICPALFLVPSLHSLFKKEKRKLDSRLMSIALYSIKNVFLLPLFPLLYFFVFGHLPPLPMYWIDLPLLRCPPWCWPNLRPWTPAHLTPRLAPPINVPLLKRAPYLTSCDWMPLPNANLHDQCSTMPVYQSQTAVAQSGMSHQLLPHCLIRKRTHVFW